MLAERQQPIVLDFIQKSVIAFMIFLVIKFGSVG